MGNDQPTPLAHGFDIVKGLLPQCLPFAFRKLVEFSLFFVRNTQVLHWISRPAITGRSSWLGGESCLPPTRNNQAPSKVKKQSSHTSQNHAKAGGCDWMRDT